jgi:hypothetical protein
MIPAAWALHRIVVQHTGSAVFVHVRTRTLDRVLARAVSTRRHLLIEGNTPITVEHGRRGCDDLATGGGWIAVANRRFTHILKSEDCISTKFTPGKLVRHYQARFWQPSTI